MRDQADAKVRTGVGAFVALVGVAGHYVHSQSFPVALDEWFIVLSLAILTILATAVRPRRSQVQRNAANPPVWQHVRAKARVKVDSRLVPVENRPLDPA